MTPNEGTAQKLSPEAQRLLLAYADQRGAAAPVGFPSHLFVELRDAHLVTPHLFLLTYRGELVREELVERRLRAMEAPSDPRDEVVAAARAWLAAQNPMALIFDGRAARLARALEALDR